MTEENIGAFSASGSLMRQTKHCGSEEGVAGPGPSPGPDASPDTPKSTLGGLSVVFVVASPSALACKSGAGRVINPQINHNFGSRAVGSHLFSALGSSGEEKLLFDELLN